MNPNKKQQVDWAESFSDRVAYGGIRYIMTFFTKTLLFSLICFSAILFLRQAHHPPESARSAVSNFGLVVFPLTLAFIIREVWGKRFYITNGVVDIRYAGWGGRCYRVGERSQFIFTEKNDINALSIKTKSRNNLWLTVPSGKRTQLQEILGSENIETSSRPEEAPLKKSECQRE